MGQGGTAESELASNCGVRRCSWIARRTKQRFSSCSRGIARRPAPAYDEQHFLDCLLPTPGQPRAVYNSFRGLRRFNAFIDDVQLEFAICFSLKDRDANYSLPKFVDRVIEVEASRRGSLVSLRNQARAGAGWQVVMFANLLLLIIGVWLRTETWAIATLLVLAVGLNATFVRLAAKQRAYLARLQDRIESRATEKLDNRASV